jgi:eukaryotic-like serine/threonine-protein kinase
MSTEPQPARKFNRRAMLFAGLGATGLGGAWLVSLATQQQPISDSAPTPIPDPEPISKPLPPSPFASPSSFSFEVVTVNETGQVVSREQNQARYFTEDLGGGVTLEMVAIPTGEFMMGPSGELERAAEDERPQRQVKVKGFSMGRFTVTQAQWQAVMGNNPAHFKGENRPVERVSWHDAQAFCKKLSQKTGRTYRLPSEAEWEYACRAGTTTPFHFGPTITTDLANYDGTYAYGSGPKGQNRQQTTPVGSFPANGFGLHDMHGNVWEWCQNRWDKDGARVQNGNSPSGLFGVLRGGSWQYGLLVSSFSNMDDIRVNYYAYGFRVVVSSP